VNTYFEKEMKCLGDGLLKTITQSSNRNVTANNIVHNMLGLVIVMIDAWEEFIGEENWKEMVGRESWKIENLTYQNHLIGWDDSIDLDSDKWEHSDRLEVLVEILRTILLVSCAEQAASIDIEHREVITEYLDDDIDQSNSSALNPCCNYLKPSSFVLKYSKEQPSQCNTLLEQVWEFLRIKPFYKSFFVDKRACGEIVALLAGKCFEFTIVTEDQKDKIH